MNGYITEYQGYCEEEEDVGRYAEEKASYMLKTAFGVNPARTFNITKKARVEKNTTVLAAAVFII